VAFEKVFDWQRKHDHTDLVIFMSIAKDMALPDPLHIHFARLARGGMTTRNSLAAKPVGVTSSPAIGGHRKRYRFFVPWPDDRETIQGVS
jgi:hypothetical protein